jgi:hypothetical protein
MLRGEGDEGSRRALRQRHPLRGLGLGLGDALSRFSLRDRYHTRSVFVRDVNRGQAILVRTRDVTEGVVDGCGCMDVEKPDREDVDPKTDLTRVAPYVIEQPRLQLDTIVGIDEVD